MDIIKLLTLSLLVSLLSCTSDPEVCISHSDSSFDKAIALKLEEIKFAHRINKKGSVCFNKSRTDEYKKTEHEVTQYYNAVATVLKSEKDKKAVFSWLKDSNIPYYTHDNDHGTFVAIGSLTEDLATENAIKLNELVHAN